MKKLFCVVSAAVIVAACCAFVGCNSGEASVNYTLSEDGTYYTVSSVTGNKRALTEYEIPATYCAEEGGEKLPVTAIADGAFYHCNSLAKITLPESLKTIGNYAFGFCGLTELTIPDGVETIGYSAFAMCKYIKTVTVPASVTSLGDRAFKGCSDLERAEVYANITHLMAETFYNSVATSGGNVFKDSKLKEIVLPSSLTKIADTAFAGNALTDIYFMGTEEQWDKLYFYTFKKNDKGESVETKLDKKEDYMPSTIKIHYNYVPGQQ